MTTHENIAATAHVLARPHYYHHTSHGSGHLSSGAAVAVLVILVIVAIGYGLYKMNESSNR